MRTIHVISPGGTLEKVFSEQTGSVENMGSKIDRYLRALRLPDLRIEAISLMNIDSLQMTDADRDQIVAAVQERLKPGEPVVITHGTDTMVETGLYLQARLGILPEPVILTGAMTPLCFEGSDGFHNLTANLLPVK